MRPGLVDVTLSYCADAVVYRTLTVYFYQAFGISITSCMLHQRAKKKRKKKVHDRKVVKIYDVLLGLQIISQKDLLPV